MCLTDNAQILFLNAQLEEQIMFYQNRVDIIQVEKKGKSSDTRNYIA